MTDETKAPEAAEEKLKAKMGRPSTLSPEWQAMADKLGGVEKLCSKVGCAERTLRHWSSGSRRPSWPIQQFISQLCIELRVAEPIYLARHERPTGRLSHPNTAKERAEVIAKRRARREERHAQAVKAFEEKYGRPYPGSLIPK